MITARRPCRTSAANSIDEMETLLGQLGDFETQIKNPRTLSSPAFHQEYTLFKQYLQWRIEDLHKAMREEMNSHIKGLNQAPQVRLISPGLSFDCCLAYNSNPEKPHRATYDHPGPKSYHH